MTPSPALSPHIQSWIDLVAGIRADLLDCLKSSLAVAADYLIAPGTYLRLGLTRPIEIDWSTDPPGLLAPLEDRLSDYSKALGLHLAEIRSDDASGWLRADAEVMLLYVVISGETLGGCVELSVVPAGDHSVLLSLGPDNLLIDAYTFDNAGGSFRPWVKEIDDATLSALQI